MPQLVVKKDKRCFCRCACYFSFIAYTLEVEIDDSSIWWMVSSCRVLSLGLRSCTVASSEVVCSSILLSVFCLFCKVLHNKTDVKNTFNVLSSEGEPICRVESLFTEWAKSNSQKKKAKFKKLHLQTSGDQWEKDVVNAPDVMTGHPKEETQACTYVARYFQKWLCPLIHFWKYLSPHLIFYK